MTEAKTNNQQFFIDRLEKVGKFFWTVGVEIVQGIKKNRIPTHKLCLPGILVAAALLLHWDEGILRAFGFKASLPLPARKFLVYFYALSGWISWGILRAIQRNILLDKLRDLFEAANLKCNGRYPSVVSDTEIDAYVRCLLLKTNGVTKTEFDKERERVEALLNISVVKIGQKESDKGLVEIIYAMRDLSTNEPFTNPEQYPVGSVPIGLGREGKIAVDLQGMGHMLVAGETGGGKSNFLKVATSVLAANDSDASVMFLDCKGGTESADLRNAIGNLQGKIFYHDGTQKAAQELVRVGGLLELRLQELADHGVSTFEEYIRLRKKQAREENETKSAPALKRTYVVIDEAAELRAKNSQVDGKLLKDACAALNRIARQGRAAGVHLIVAIQKPDASNFDQTVKANLPGVLCFPMPTNAASISAIGTGRAFDLNPGIKGRAIWKFGPKLEEVQTYLFS